MMSPHAGKLGGRPVHDRPGRGLGPVPRRRCGGARGGDGGLWCEKVEGKDDVRIGLRGGGGGGGHCGGGGSGGRSGGSGADRTKNRKGAHIGRCGTHSLLRRRADRPLSSAHLAVPPSQSCAFEQRDMMPGCRAVSPRTLNTSPFRTRSLANSVISPAIFASKFDHFYLPF